MCVVGQCDQGAEELLGPGDMIETMKKVRVALRWKVSKDLGIWKRPLQFQAVSKVLDLILQCVYSCDISSYTKILKTRLIKQKQLRESLIYKSIAKSNQIPMLAGKHSSKDTSKTADIPSASKQSAHSFMLVLLSLFLD